MARHKTAGCLELPQAPPKIKLKPPALISLTSAAIIDAIDPNQTLRPTGKDPMKEADFYRREQNDKVRCLLCNHRCLISNGHRGICGVRENRKAVLYSLVYGKVISRSLDPIEKKPLFHFLPGTSSFSISTVGCNFRCEHCQNWQISQYPRLISEEIPGDDYTPGDIVAEALAAGARSISYTYVEPTIFFEFAYDCMVEAQRSGLKNVFVSNGYMTAEVVDKAASVLHGINIDLKAFTERFYKQVCGASLAPVLENIRLFREKGVWVEVTTLVIPEWNDSPEELAEIARFIASIDKNIPWHVSAFYPTFKMTDKPPTPLSTLELAVEIGRDAGLNFVYQGNLVSEGGEDTRCPSCKEKLIIRNRYIIRENRIASGACPSCGNQIPGVWS